MVILHRLDIVMETLTMVILHRLDIVMETLTMVILHRLDMLCREDTWFLYLTLHQFSEIPSTDHGLTSQS